MSHQKNTPSKAAHLRRRRPSTELTRANICSKCGNAYEEFRTMQQHLMQKHNIRVSLRDKDEYGRVIERPLPRTQRKATNVTAHVEVNAHPRPPPSPMMYSTSESEGSDGEDDGHTFASEVKQQPVTPMVSAVIKGTTADDADSWQPLELRVSDEDAEAMGVWGELSFARLAGDLLYSEDEIGRMFDELMKNEGGNTGPSSSQKESDCFDGVPDHVHVN